MLNLRVHAELLLGPVHEPGGASFLSAASGLVQTREHWVVVADDDHHLVVFDRQARVPPQRIRLFEGDLPLDAKERKALKPDLEALTQLPAFPGFPDGALMAFGSGSKPRRHRGVLLPLGALAPVSEIDLTAFYAPLHDRFSLLNIEGAFVDRDQLCLLQRANKGDPTNACIRWPLAEVLVWLAEAVRGRPATPPAMADIDLIELGLVDGVPLSFTDGCSLPDGGWLFSAVAEDTSDNYLDGACVAAAVGWVDAAGCLCAIERLAHPWKVEGLAAEARGDGFALTLVTDADDPDTPAKVIVGDWTPERRDQRHVQQRD
ncbi:MAG: hypothetical protein RLZZ618_2436 [Pseudomonadota bacterium]|jgi:hypothetical protein